MPARSAVEEWTNFTLLLRLHAARIGVPFLPSRALLAGDIPKASADARKITCPFTGESLSAIPALLPEIALIHAQRADEDGNVQMWGIDGDTREGALASRVVIATVEEIVPGRSSAPLPKGRSFRRTGPPRFVTCPEALTLPMFKTITRATTNITSSMIVSPGKRMNSPPIWTAMFGNVADREAYLNSLDPGVLERIGIARRVHAIRVKTRERGPRGGKA